MEACAEELGYAYPIKKVVINLSPSYIRKRGAYLDLPMLVGLLIESVQVRSKIETWEEIALTYSINTTGALVGLDRILPMVIQARNLGWKSMLVPLILLLP